MQFSEIFLKFQRIHKKRTKIFQIDFVRFIYVCTNNITRIVEDLSILVVCFIKYNLRRNYICHPFIASISS